MAFISYHPHDSPGRSVQKGSDPSLRCQKGSSDGTCLPSRSLRLGVAWGWDDNPSLPAGHSWANQSLWEKNVLFEDLLVSHKYAT